MSHNVQPSKLIQLQQASASAASTFNPGFIVGKSVLKKEMEAIAGVFGNSLSKFEALIGDEKCIGTPLRKYHKNLFQGQFEEVFFSKMVNHSADGKGPFKVMDIGCSDGTQWLDFFNKYQLDGREIEFVGTSLTPDYLNQRIRPYCVYGLVTDLPNKLPAEYFDFISADMSTHFQEYGALEVILYHLKIGGEAAVSGSLVTNPVLLHPTSGVYTILKHAEDGMEMEWTYHIQKIGPYQDISAGVDPNWNYGGKAGELTFAKGIGSIFGMPGQENLPCDFNTLMMLLSLLENEK